MPVPWLGASQSSKPSYKTRVIEEATGPSLLQSPPNNWSLFTVVEYSVNGQYGCIQDKYFNPLDYIESVKKHDTFLQLLAAYYVTLLALGSDMKNKASASYLYQINCQDVDIN